MAHLRGRVGGCLRAASCWQTDPAMSGRAGARRGTPEAWFTFVVLALVLGYMMESNFRRAMLQSGGDPMVFAWSPISATCLVLALAMLVLPIVQDLRRTGSAINGLQ